MVYLAAHWLPSVDIIVGTKQEFHLEDGSRPLRALDEHAPAKRLFLMTLPSA
jgi:hypothetical protein